MAAETMPAQIMVRMSADMYEELRSHSEEEERTVAQTVRLAIKKYLANR